VFGYRKWRLVTVAIKSGGKLAVETGWQSLREDEEIGGYI
jgi:hypothetical protein